MSEQNNEDTKKVYLTIMADGKFHQKVEEGTPGAVLREYTLTDKETKEETKHTKLELITDEVAGMITKVDTYDGQYGKNFILEVETADGPVTISASTAQNFGEDMLHKILSVDMKLPVRLVPFIRMNTKGKEVKGVEIYHGAQKVQSYFQSYDKEANKFVSKNGFPESPVAKAGKKISSDEWKMFFMQARLFMIERVEAHFNINHTDGGF